MESDLLEEADRGSAEEGHGQGNQVADPFTEEDERSAREDQSLRQKAEKDEKVRWIRELKKQLEDGDCPAVASSSGASELTRRFGKGRRANTLRKHVKTWEKLSSWVRATFQHAWLEGAGEFAAYFREQGRRAICGKSVSGRVCPLLRLVQASETVDGYEVLGYVWNARVDD